jgi:hypothetical protein
MFGTSDTSALAQESGGNLATLAGIVTSARARVVLQASAIGGTTANHAISANSTNGTSVKASPGNLYGLAVSNVTASPRYFKLYNKATAPIPGTDTPITTIAVPASSTVIRVYPVGLFFSTGIGYGATGAIADADATVIGAGDLSMDVDTL